MILGFSFGVEDFKLRVQGLVFGVQGVGFRVEGLWSVRCWGSVLSVDDLVSFMAKGLWFMVYCLWFMVYGLGPMVRI